MMVLDTDHITILERMGTAQRERLHRRLEPIPPEQKATTIISFEEQICGWLAVLAKGSAVAQQIEAYRPLHGSWKSSAAFRFSISTNAPPSSFSGCARIASASARWI
jgi:hypothetical protein